MSICYPRTVIHVVLASLGIRVPCEVSVKGGNLSNVRATISTSRPASSGAAPGVSLPSSAPLALPAQVPDSAGITVAIFVRQLYAILQDRSVESSLDNRSSASLETTSAHLHEGAAVSGSGNHAPGRPPLMELFLFSTLEPLAPTSIVQEGDSVLLFCTGDLSRQLVKRLSERWLDGSKEPTDIGDGTRSEDVYDAQDRKQTMLACPFPEQRLNLQRSVTALGRPPSLHYELLQKERKGTLDFVKVQKDALEYMQRRLSEIATEPSEARMPSILRELGGEAIDMGNLRSFEEAVEVCKDKLIEADQLCAAAGASDAYVVQLLSEEHQFSKEFESLPLWAETDSSDMSLLPVYQREVERKLASVRAIISHITKARRRMQRAKNVAGVVEMVSHHFTATETLPDVLKEAENLLRRRVVLQRAVRRLLLPLQVVHRELAKETHAMLSKRSAGLLPETIRGLLETPIMQVVPLPDPVADAADPYVVDTDVDEAEELLHAIGARGYTGGSHPSYTQDPQIVPVQKGGERDSGTRPQSAHASLLNDA